VTHAVTGRPVAGAVVHYHPLYPNPHVARQGPNGAGTIPCSWTRAGADGTFRLVVLPGPGLLGTTAYAAQETFRPAAVTAQELRDLFQDDADHGNGEQIRIQASTTGWSVVGPGQYNAVKLINPGEKDTAVTWDATLQPAPPLKGRVVGPDGQPAAGVIAFHLAPGILSQRLEKGAFTVEGLGRQPRQVVFLDRELKHGAAVAVKADTPGPLTVRLEPCGAVGGRLLDQDGAPKAGAVVRVEATTFLAGPPTVTAQTDAAGRFRLDGLIPGMTYQVRYGPGPFGAYLGGAFVAKSGGVRELGECRLRAGP
jgi:hypothetical protein